MSSTPSALVAIVAELRAALDAGADQIELIVADPDRGRGRFAGERVVVDGQPHVHRPWRVWVDLAERLELRLLTPRPRDDGRLLLTFERLAPRADRRDWAVDAEADPREKYGARSAYARIAKAEDPGFVLDLAEALERARLPPAPRVLDLGCNDGEVLELIAALLGADRAATLVGVDHSPSAIAAARARLPGQRLLELDLNQLCADPHAHALGRFDLVVALNTLHSPGVDERALLGLITRELLAPAGALVLGLPNCTYRDGEQLFGARTLNITRQAELSLLVKRVAYYRRYLHKRTKRVFVTGKYYVLVTAVCERRGA